MFDYFGKLFNFQGVTGIGILVLAGLMFVGIGGYFAYRWWAKRVARDIEAEEAETPVTDETNASPPDQPVKKAGKYAAYVWYKNEGLKYQQIPERIGKLYYADTSMPHSGSCYLVVPDGKGYKAYDPRDEQLGVSPGKLYRATRVQAKVQAVFTSLTGLWEKINQVLAYCGVAAFCFTAIVIADMILKAR